MREIARAMGKARAAVVATSILLAAAACDILTTPESESPHGPVASITIGVPDTSLVVGQAVPANCLPLNKQGHTILVENPTQWTSSDTTVATVSATAKGQFETFYPVTATITGKAPGTAIITVFYAAGNSVQTSPTVTVAPPP